MSLFGQASGNTLKGKINRLTELRGYSAYEVALIHGFVGTEEEWLDSIYGLSESWAVGDTGLREGEDTNNAKYWAEQAAAVAGGGVSTFNGRTGVVVPQTGDYTAAMVGARPVNWMPTYSDVGADKAGAAAEVSSSLTQQISTNTQQINANTQQINANTQQINTKQSKISTASITLAAEWTGEESPYSQTVTIPGVTAAKMVDLQPTPEQISALIENGTAGLQAVNNSGTVTVYALGEKPTEAMTMQATLVEVV